MKFTLTFVVVTCFATAFVFAQPPAGVYSPPASVNPKPQEEILHGKRKIKGIVKDSSTKEPVEYATVALYNVTTNKAVDGAVCDEKGAFEISKIHEGEYKLVLVFMGFKNKEINNIKIEKEDLDLGELFLSPISQVTQEVVVEGEKAVFEEKVDRVVYNAENDATNKGGDATDVLRKAPMLSVDQNGNVSLRGSQNVRVLVNGKPSAIMASNLADALKQIPADQIKSVEVITSPSAKYDAEGSVGIINIILKKNNLEGFSLGVDASVGWRASNLGLNGSYKKGKMGFSLGGFGRGGYNVPGSFENRQRTISPEGTATVNTQKADTRNENIFGQYTLGWDYDISKNNSLSSTVKYSLRNNYTYQDHLATLAYRNDSLLNSNTRNVNVKDISNTVDVSLNFTHLFQKPQREFSLLTLYSNNFRNNDFTNAILNNADLNVTDSKLKNQNKSNNEEITVQADFQNPFGDKQLFEVGAKNILRKVSSDYQYFSAVGNGDFAPIVDSRLNNVFSYNQNVTAAYATHTISFCKTYSLKAGARYEYTTIAADFQSQQNGKVDIPAYGVLVPSINLSKKLNKFSTLKASFSRRLQRPSIQFLNPNIQASNPLNPTFGNPKLSPEYTNNYELGYSIFTKVGSFGLTAFARNTTDAIQSVRNVEGNTIQTTYQNIGSEDAYGFNFFSNINASSKLTLNGGFDLFYVVLKNNVPNPLYNASNEGWVPSIRAFGGYKLGKGYALQLFGFYRSKQIQLQGMQGGFGVYSLNLNKEFNDKKGTFGFGFENFFTPTFYIPSSVNSPLIEQSTTTMLHNFSFRVNFGYRIGKTTTSDRPRRRKSVNNDDLKEGGDNNNPTGGSGAPTGGGGGQPSGGAPSGTPQGGGGQRPPASGTPGQVPAGTPVPNAPKP